MTTTYSNGVVSYNANLDNGVTSGSVGFSLPVGDLIPDAVYDEAATAFFNVINETIPITSSSKRYEASGATDWQWTAPA